jgi:hypothetical protein
MEERGELRTKHEGNRLAMKPLPCDLVAGAGQWNRPIKEAYGLKRRDSPPDAGLGEIEIRMPQERAAINAEREP